MVTAANVHDKHRLPDLLHGNEQRVYGDSADASQKALIESKAPSARLHEPARAQDGAQRSARRTDVSPRFAHASNTFSRWSSGSGGFSKVHYRGLAKNAMRSFLALRLANIYLARSHAA